MKLRDYQVQCVNSILNYFEQGGKGNPIAALPTGTGKSPCIAGLIQKVLFQYPNQRILKLTHVKELIVQNYEKLLAVWPTAPAGIFSSGLKRWDSGYPIIYAGIATAINDVEAFGRIDLIIIDECHLVSPRETTQYRVFIDRLKIKNPFLKVIGFTATPYRAGQGLLTEPGGLFTDICFDMTTLKAFNWLLSEGYLCRLIPRQPTLELDVEGVPVQHGEYNLNELQKAVDKEEITYAALKEALDLASDRGCWLIFASGIKHAVNITSMLESLGVSATCVHSKMPGLERDQRIADYKAGVYKVMVNNGILTTGFDHPAIDVIVVLRPTLSTVLWVQMLGRGTRPSYAVGNDLSTSEGRKRAINSSQKQNCLVLDFAGNTRKLGPINDPVLPKKKKKGSGTAPVRICESCGVYCHASLTHCPECFYEFPRAIKFGTVAATDDLIKGEVETPKIESYKISKVVYSTHKKEGRPDSLKVSYYCSFNLFQEWICFEHTGFARRKAEKWWQERATDEPPPDTITEAFTRLAELRVPVQVRVWINKPHPEIVGYQYADDRMDRISETAD
jgi:DNA repair protein RadD